MSDIVERLRDPEREYDQISRDCDEAADEIERLRRLVDDLEDFLRGAAKQFVALADGGRVLEVK